MSSIQTNSGKSFDFAHPEDHPYEIEEIAHALSNLCRFTGHVSHFYSVAEHSVNVSYLVPREFKMAALLHDASEAYLGDVSSPLKAILLEYKRLECKVERCIAQRFNFPYGLFPLDQCVKYADLQMLIREKKSLLPNLPTGVVWPDVEPAQITVRALSPYEARSMFLSRYNQLKGWI